MYVCLCWSSAGTHREQDVARLWIGSIGALHAPLQSFLPRGIACCSVSRLTDPHVTHFQQTTHMTATAEKTTTHWYMVVVTYVQYCTGHRGVRQLSAYIATLLAYTTTHLLS